MTALRHSVTGITPEAGRVGGLARLLVGIAGSTRARNDGSVRTLY